MDTKSLRALNYSRDKVTRGRRLLEKNKGKRCTKIRKNKNPDYEYGMGKTISEMKYIKKDIMFGSLPFAKTSQSVYVI